MFLLDTNVISELRKAGDRKADANVTTWLSSMDAESFYISAVTLMELEQGILRMERRDPAQGARLRAWMDGNILPESSERTLPVDRTVALRCVERIGWVGPCGSDRIPVAWVQSRMRRGRQRFGDSGFRTSSPA